MLERFQIFLKQLQQNLTLFFNGLTRARKITLFVCLGIAALAIIVAETYRPETKFEVAYSNLSQDDRNSMLAFLKKSNIHDFKVEGETISFPQEKSLDYKMQLAQEGLPNNGTNTGWEKFDERAFGMTDFDQRINRLRAIQGEMSRTINRLEPVENSRVHIVIPDAAVFAEDKKATTASISLKLRPGKSLNQRQIQGVLHLVARAVEGLDVKNITIIDQDGNMLTKPDEDDGGLDKVTSTQREYQKRVEHELEGKIREILGRVVGQGKVVAKVQAEVEFKKVETTIQDVDPERSAVIASQRSEQSSSGVGLNPTGVPGAKSNLPAEREDAASGGSSNSNKQNTENLNYDVKKTFSKIIEPVGTLKKISTAVLVDGKMVEGKYVARSPEDIAMITKLVKNAIGHVDTRDSITVENTQFEMDEFQVAEQQSQSTRKNSLLQTGIFSAVAVSAMFFLYFALIKPYFRWLTFDPNKRSEEEFAVGDYELERSGVAAKRVQVQEDVPFEKLTPKEQIMYLAKNDPKKTTEALRQLLSPNHN